MPDKDKSNRKLFKLRDEWYKEARNKKMTLRTLPLFLEKLAEYNHDYNTIVYAMAAAGVAAMTALDRSPNGGITGFQAGAVMWEIADAWGVWEKGPKKLLSYANMLYPQYEHTFEKVIRKETAKWLKDQAKKRLAERDQVHPDVRRHWELLAAGHLPFGFKLEVERERT